MGVAVNCCRRRAEQFRVPERLFEIICVDVADRSKRLQHRTHWTLVDGYSSDDETMIRDETGVVDANSSDRQRRVRDEQIEQVLFTCWALNVLRHVHRLE